MSFKELLQRRKGFTLIELLMSISIIAILSTLAIAILRGAENDARAARTATVVGSVRAVIQARMEAYEGRRLPFRFSVLGVTDYADKTHIRQRVLAEWFRGEMPTSVIDLTDPYPNNGHLQQFPSHQTRQGGVIAGLPAPPNNGMALSPEIIELSDRLGLRPPAMVTRLRRHFQMTDSGGGVWVPPATFDPRFQDAECLYAILNNSWDGHRRGTHFLNTSEIGDTDGDGFLEVLDAWGEPLNFQIAVPRDSDGDGDVDLADDRTIDPDRPFELNDFQIDIRSNRSDQL